MSTGGRSRDVEFRIRVNARARKILRIVFYAESVALATVAAWSYINLRDSSSWSWFGTGAVSTLAFAIAVRDSTSTALAKPLSTLPLRRAVRFLTTAKGFREVFEPTFTDMDAEYFEALSRKDYFEARKIVIAYHWKVGMLLAARPVVRAFPTVLGWMKAG